MSNNEYSTDYCGNTTIVNAVGQTQAVQIAGSWYTPVIYAPVEDPPPAPSPSFGNFSPDFTVISPPSPLPTPSPVYDSPPPCVISRSDTDRYSDYFENTSGEIFSTIIYITTWGGCFLGVVFGLTGIFNSEWNIANLFFGFLGTLVFGIISGIGGLLLGVPLAIATVIGYWLYLALVWVKGKILPNKVFLE